MHPVENLRGLKVRTLEKTYNGISHTFRLTNKGDFRSKFGIEQEPVSTPNNCSSKGYKKLMFVLSVHSFIFVTLRVDLVSNFLIFEFSSVAHPLLLRSKRGRSNYVDVASTKVDNLHYKRHRSSNKRLVVVRFWVL